MKKAWVMTVLLGLFVILYGCGAGVIHQTTQKDRQSIDYGDTQEKAKRVFSEGALSVRSYVTGKALKFTDEGFQAGTDRQTTCEYEAIGDPYVKDWGPFALDSRFGVHMDGCEAQFWFGKQETAMQYAQLLYTLKQQAKENKMARNKPLGAFASAGIKAVESEIDTPPASLSAGKGNACAIVIGIENYRSLPRSDYSGRDAGLMKDYLKALGYQERNIDLLINEKATRTDLEKALEAWLPNKVKKDSTVFVYFSGHGAPEPATGDAYLVPYDGDPNYLPVTGYSLKRLYEKLGKLGAKEVIVVLDSCFSGAGGRSVLAKGARPLVMMTTAGTLASNMVVLSATQGGQISTSSPDKGHGVFTYYFLKAIKDGKKDIADIYEQLVPQVEDEAKKLNVEQSPSVSPSVEKLKGRFALK